MFARKTTIKMLLLIPSIYSLPSFLLLLMVNHIIRNAGSIAGERYEELVIIITLALALIICSTLRFVQRLALTGKYASIYLQCPEHTQSFHRAITTSLGPAIAAAFLSTLSVLLISIVFSMNHFMFTLCIAYFVLDSEVEWTSLTHIAIFNTSFLQGVFQAYVSPLLSDEYVLSMMPAITTLFSVSLSCTIYHLMTGWKDGIESTELLLSLPLHLHPMPILCRGIQGRCSSLDDKFCRESGCSEGRVQGCCFKDCTTKTSIFNFVGELRFLSRRINDICHPPA